MPKEEVKIVKPRFSIGLSTIILTILMLILPLAFFFLLSQETGDNFGLIQILFSIVLGLIITIILVWLKNFMKNRPYLGLIIGLISLGVADYALFFRYKGPYTSAFAVVGALVVLIYLGFYFFKNRRSNTEVKDKEEFDDDF